MPDRRPKLLMVAAVLWVLVGAFFFYPFVTNAEAWVASLDNRLGLLRTLSIFVYVSVPIMFVVGGVLAYVKRRYVFLALPFIALALFYVLPVLGAIIPL